MGAGDVGARRVALAGPQTACVLSEGLRNGLVRSEFSTEPVQLSRELGDAPGPFCVRRIEVGSVAHRRELSAELFELPALVVDLDPQGATPRGDVGPLFEDGLQRLGRGSHFVEPGPSDGVVPGAVDALVAVVHGPRWSILAFEGVPGVESP